MISFLKNFLKHFIFLSVSLIILVSAVLGVENSSESFVSGFCQRAPSLPCLPVWMAIFDCMLRLGLNLWEIYRSKWMFSPKRIRVAPAWNQGDTLTSSFQWSRLKAGVSKFVQSFIWLFGHFLFLFFSPPSFYTYICFFKVNRQSIFSYGTFVADRFCFFHNLFYIGYCLDL